MPARKIQTLLRNPNERKHREHRSKKGRTYVPYKQNVRDFKNHRVHVTENELDDEIREIL